MVIAHVLNDDGGVGRVVETLCNAQVRDGHKVYVVTSNGKQKFLENVDPEVQVLLIYRNRRIPQILDGIKLRSVYKRLRRKHPDENVVIHAHNLVSVGLLARLKKVPLICTIHGLSKFPNAKDTFRSRLQTVALGVIIRKILRCGGKVYGVSQHTSNYYAAVSKKSVDTIYNGTPEVPLTCTADGKSFKVVHIGDISKAKGWDCSLLACSIMKQKNPEIDIQYMSAGRLCDINAEMMSQMIKQSGLTQREVHYFGFLKDPGQTYCQAQVLVLASDSEGLPMSILEAQSFGVPVVVTNVGGCAEVIENGVNGFVVHKDACEIAQALEKLATDRDLWCSVSEKAKQIHRERFSSAVMIDSYYQSYKAIGVKNGIR